MANNVKHKKLNFLIILFSYLIILNHVWALLFSMLYFPIDCGSLWSVNVLQDIEMIIIMICILQKRRWAVYFFFVFQALNVVVLNYVQNASSRDVALSIVIALLYSALLSGLLCLKKNGISGWYAIFNNEGQDEPEDSVEKNRNENVEYIKAKKVETNSTEKTSHSNHLNKQRHLTAKTYSTIRKTSKWALLTIALLVIVVTVETALLLSESSNSSKAHVHEITQEQTESRLKLYQDLKDLGYNVGKNYHEFDSLLSCRKDSREWVYNKATEEGLFEGTFEQFEKKFD